jgi:RNA-directed DNA polymerase
MQRHQPDAPFERYADDVVVHCRSAEEAQSVLAAIRERFEQCGLELHPTKTRIVYCKDYRRPGNSEHVMFDFLGHTFRARPARGPSGRVFYGFNPAISASAAKRIRERIHSWNLLSRTQEELRALFPQINRVVRGWYNYYSQFFPSVCRGVLQSVNNALVNWALHKYKRFRRSWCAAAAWLRRIAKTNKDQFVLWSLNVMPSAARVRAV